MIWQMPVCHSAQSGGFRFYYKLHWQLELPRAVVSCMTFCVSSRYRTYGYFYYVATKCLSSPHLLRPLSVRVGGRDHPFFPLQVL